MGRRPSRLARAHAIRDAGSIRVSSDEPPSDADQPAGAPVADARAQANLTVAVADASGRAVASSVLPFPGRAVVIGADPLCDIVLPAAGAPRLCEIEVVSALLGDALSVRAAVDGVLLNAAPLPVGLPRVAGGRAVVTAGPVEIVALAPKGRGLRERGPKAASIAALGGRAAAFSSGRMLAGACVAGGVALAGLAALIPAAPAPPAAPAAAIATRQAALRVDPRRESTLDSVRRLIGQIDVASPLSVQNQGGVIVVAGSVSEEERARIVETLSRGAGGGLPVRLDLDPTPVNRLVAAVSIAPRKFIVGRDGRRYVVGDAIGDGYRLERIDPERVVVSRDGLLESMPVTTP